MVLVYGVGIWMTIANAWFFMAAIGTDLLWLRFYLFAAYVFLFIAGLTNYPPWGIWHRINGDLWLIGGILWPFIVGLFHLHALAVLCWAERGLFHLHGLAVLCWDERPVRLASRDDEELWRLVYRRSGMGRLEFKQALKLGRWRRFRKGEVIFDTQGERAASATSLHLMVEGVAMLTAKRDEGSSATSSLYSGYLFNLAVCNAFGVYVGLERAPIEKVVATTDCLLYKWDLDAVEKMASPACAALAAAWRNLVLYAVGAAFSSTCDDIYASNGDSEVPGFFEGARSRDLIEPLLEEEQQRIHPWSWLKWFILMHNPIVPSGLRHNSMPNSGMRARGRLLASSTVRDTLLPHRSSTRLHMTYSEKIASHC